MHEVVTYLGFDFGLKRIGVAVGQSLTCTTTALTILPAQAGVPPWAKIDELLQTWHPSALVIGIPFHADGSRAPITEKAETFALEMQTYCQLPVHQVDERLTTHAARDRLKNKQTYKSRQLRVDSIAAQIILEQWLRRGIP